MLLEVDKLTKCFPGQDIPVLNNVSFSVEIGERAGLIGESGSGKTTLARIIAGLECADSGSVSFNGAQVNYSSIKSMRTPFRDKQTRSAWLDMQMVFQNPLATFSNHMNIEDAVWEGAVYHAQFSSCSKRERNKRVVDALDAVGLNQSFLKRRAFELSGGECQRVAIARALISEPKLIICDEATSALDVTVQARIMDLLKQLQKEHGMAFIFISHNAALVQDFCDTIYSIGQIA